MTRALPRRRLLAGTAALAAAAAGSRSSRAGAADLLTFDGLYKSYGVTGFAFADRDARLVVSLVALGALFAALPALLAYRQPVDAALRG